jgi:PAS domain-containing protein
MFTSESPLSVPFHLSFSHGCLHFCIFILLYRLVALSSAPFTVVHVNGSYTRMTGLSSVHVLGRPLADLMDQPEWLPPWPPNASSSSSRLHPNFTTVPARTATGKSQVVGLVVTPVGADADTVTHLTLDFTESTSSANVRDRAEQDRAYANSPPAAAVPMGAIG